MESPTAAAHRCAGCSRLYYPEPGPGAAALRDDAIIVGLGDREIERAKRLGAHRAGSHRRDKLRDRFEPEDRLDNDVQAAGAELAVARIVGLELQPERAKTDVGPYGVRRSTLDCMPVREHERETPRLVEIFVTGTLPVYIIRGWIRVEEAWARKEWYRPDPPPYACVPMAELHDLRRLPEIRARLVR